MNYLIKLCVQTKQHFEHNKRRRPSMISALLPLVGIGRGHEIKKILAFITTLSYAVKKTGALLERYKEKFNL